MESQRDTDQEATQTRNPLTAKQYEKFADWNERAALVALGSLVVQQMVEGAPLTRPSVIVGVLAAAILYVAAYRLMSRSN